MTIVGQRHQGLGEADRDRAEGAVAATGVGSAPREESPGLVQHIVVPNDKVRLKLTDGCALACPFCHSEGAVGAGDINPHDERWIAAMTRLRRDYPRVHLTGGEPTTSANLESAASALRELGYRLSMTSNGLFNIRRLEPILGWFEYINVSFHSLRPAYLQSFTRSGKVTMTTVEAIKRNVLQVGRVTPVRINTVITGSRDEQQLRSLHEWAMEHEIELKLVPDWRTSRESLDFIHEYIDSWGYRLFESVRIMPGSNKRLRYRGDGAGILEVKQIEPFRPKFLCAGCEVVDRCHESFSFLRVEDDPTRYRLCINKAAVTAAEFFPLLETHIAPNLALVRNSRLV